VIPRRTLVQLAIGAAAVAAVLLVANIPFGSSHGLLLPRKAPLGIVLLGLIYGAINSMVAIGLVLVYRAGRYINFAQGGPGAAGAMVTSKLLQIFFWHGLPLYVLAGLAGIVAAGVLGLVVELVVFQLLRFYSASRLIVTAVTIGLLGVFGIVQTAISGIQADRYFGQILNPSLALHGGVQVNARVGLVYLDANKLAPLVIVPLVVLALGLFLRFTDWGSAIQAAAENSDRARLVGIPVRLIHSLVWTIAGLLSGLTALLAWQVGISPAAGGGIQLFVLALAPAFVAGMQSLGWTFAASLALGVVQSVTSWNFQFGPLNFVLFLVVLGALLLRPRLAARTTEAEERSFGTFARVRPFPRELAGIEWLQAVRWGLRIAVLAVAVVIPMGFDLQRQLLAEQVILLALAGLSLTVLTGFSGQVSFGQWALVGFGALFGGWLATVHHVDFWIGLVVIALTGAAVAALTGLPALRVRGLFLGASTLAMALASADFAFRLPIFQLSGSVSRPSLPGGLDLGAEPSNELRFYWLCLAVLVLAIALIGSFRRSRWGRNLLAVRDNERAAGAYGVSPLKAKLLGFSVAGMITATAGYLLLYSSLRVDSTFFPVQQSLSIFAAVVIGGLGSPLGAILGALFIEGVQYFVPIPAVQGFATTTGMIIVLAFMPGGLSTLVFGARDLLLRWIARRRGILVPSLVADYRPDEVEPEPPAAVPMPAVAT
jgi:branched-chain amino acid transport system permease protein